MLEQAASEWPINRDASFLVGDKDADVGAAEHLKFAELDLIFAWTLLRPWCAAKSLLSLTRKSGVHL